MPARKKLIVFITMSGYDNSFAVLAEQRENGFIAIEGSQLLLADRDEGEANKWVNKDALYHLHRGDYKVKCNDCYTFNKWAFSCEPTVDTSYVMKCQKYNDKTGSPGFKIKEAIAAGLPAWKVNHYGNDGLLYIRPYMLRAC